MVDFSTVKDRVRMTDVIQAYGLQMKGREPQLRGECPYCKSGGPRALAVHTEKNSFYCFSAKAGGDVIAAVAHVTGKSQRDAAEELAKRFSVSTSPAPEPQKKTDTLYLDALKDMIEDLEERVSALEDGKIVKLRAP